MQLDESMRQFKVALTTCLTAVTDTPMQAEVDQLEQQVKAKSAELDRAQKDEDRYDGWYDPAFAGDADALARISNRAAYGGKPRSSFLALFKRETALLPEQVRRSHPGTKAAFSERIGNLLMELGELRDQLRAAESAACCDRANRSAAVVSAILDEMRPLFAVHSLGRRRSGHLPILPAPETAKLLVHLSTDMVYGAVNLVGATARTEFKRLLGSTKKEKVTT